ncbi:S26 family signal peptidase [Sinomicrobium sp. M5D2P17]
MHNGYDITIFNHPYDHKHVYVKRCMGISGDTIRINDGDVFCNDVLVYQTPTVQNSYKIWFNDHENLNTVLLRNNISPEFKKTNRLDSTKFIIRNLTRKQYSILNASGIIDSMKLNDFEIKIFSEKAYSNDTIFWTTNNYGPIVIPKKGTSIKLTKNNWILYRKVLERYEGATLENRREVFFVNGVKVARYRFKKNYYFMMGDNRHNSIDSRHWGFVCEEDIIGKGVMNLYAIENGKVGWNRLLRILK